MGLFSFSKKSITIILLHTSVACVVMLSNSGDVQTVRNHNKNPTDWFLESFLFFLFKAAVCSIVELAKLS